MRGRFEVRKWIQMHQPVLAVAQSFDGQYIAVGLEQGVAVFNLSGNRLGDYPASGEPTPVHRLASAPDFGQLYAGTRTGAVIRLDLEFQDERVSFREKNLYATTNDLHSLSLAKDAAKIAVGHFSPGLSVFQTDGQSVWRQQDLGPAAEGRTWTVALNERGDRLYAGSAGASTNRLALLNAADGTPIAGIYLDERVTSVAAIAEGKGVAVVLAEDFYTSRMVAYDADLGEILWEHVFDESVTALTADTQRAILVAGVGYMGQVTLIDASSGQIVASEQTKSVINDLSIVEGRLVAAATQDGYVALLRYLG